MIRQTEKWQSGCPEASGAADKIYGEMAERLNAAVLKTVLVKANGGSNPSFSAKQKI